VQVTVRRDRGTLIVSVGDVGASLWLRSDGLARHWGDIPGPNAHGVIDASAQAEVRAQCQRLPADLRQVVLEVSNSAVLRLTLELPAATEENLAEVLAFEMDRHTPFRADQVYFGYDIESRDRQRRRIRVRLRVLARATVDAWCQWLDALGLAPTIVGCRDADSGAMLEPVDCGLARGAREPVWQGRIRWAAAAVVAGAAVVSLVLPLNELRDRGRTLGAQVAQARAQANQVLHTLDEIKTLRERAELLVRRKSQMPPVVELLAEVARIFPDDTWVSRFELTNEGVRIRGESKSASALIGMLEESRLFHGAQFASPVTRNQSTDRDRFVLAVKVRKDRWSERGNESSSEPNTGPVGERPARPAVGVAGARGGSR